MNQNTNAFKDSALLIAAGTGFLYAAGTTHYAGFLEELLLNPNILDRNFHQVMYQGFLVSALPLLILVAVVFGSVMLYSQLFLPLWFKFFQKRFARKRRLLQIVGPFRIRKTTPAAETRAVRTTISLGKLFAISYLLFFLLNGSLIDGQEQATALLERIETGEMKESAYVTAHTSDGDLRLIALTCGARNCAGLNETTGRVTYYPQGLASFALIMVDDAEDSGSAD